jgi:hypothetical protein
MSPGRTATQTRRRRCDQSCRAESTFIPPPRARAGTLATGGQQADAADELPGAGKMIQAPETGENVEVVPADTGSEFAGAVRADPALGAAVVGSI